MRAFYQLGAKFFARSSATTYGAARQQPTSRTELATRIGLSPRNAIAAATTSYVRGLWPDVGRTETGRNADLLILSKDPRSELSALEATDEVILNGVAVEMASLLSLKKRVGLQRSVLVFDFRSLGLGLAKATRDAQPSTSA